MSVVFCCPFDVDYESCNGETASSTSGNEIIDTTNQKFGVGCLGSAPGTLDFNAYEDIAGTDGDEGAIGWWLRAVDVTTDDARWQPTVSGAGSVSFITIQLTANFTTNQLQYFVQMRNAAGGGVVLEFGNTGAPDNNWHYVELNWLWNDAGGKTELFWDGVSQFSVTDGNAETRVVGDLDIRLNSEANNGAAVNHLWDDFTFWDERQHTSGFANPTTPSCVCGPVGKNTFGYPFGQSRGFGR